MKQDPRVAAEAELSVLRRIWGAFLFAPLLYAVLIYFVQGDVGGRNDEMFRWMAVFLGVLAGIQLLIVFVLKQMVAGLTKDNYRAFCLVRWAIVEAIAVYGLVQRFLGAELYVPLAFVLLSFMMTLTMAPSANEAADLQQNWR